MNPPQINNTVFKTYKLYISNISTYTIVVLKNKALLINGLLINVNHKVLKYF